MKWPRMWWLLLVAAAAIPVCLWAGSAGHVVDSDATPLPTGKFIRPVGRQTAVGSYPANMALSPDGAYLIVTDTGFRQQLSVLDAHTGASVSQLEMVGDSNGRKSGLYYGLAFGNRQGKTLLYASRGSEDAIAEYDLSDAGELSPLGMIKPFEPRNDHEPVVAGVAVSPDGRFLYAVDNNTCEETNMRGLVSVMDPATGKVLRRIEVAGFPLAVVATNEAGHNKAYVSSERDGVVVVVDPIGGKVTKRIGTGLNPTALYLDAPRHRLYVSNSGSDTVGVIDTQRDKLVDSILVRPVEMRGLPGASPLGIAANSDGSRLYVSLSDMNAVAVVDTGSNKVAGYISTGWYPTAVCISSNGSQLFVSNAKGVDERNPNDKPQGPDGKNGQYIQNLLEGTVSTIDVAGATSNLAALTEETIANNRLDSPPDTEFHNPGIQHVVYIIKENRTYDQVLGDDPRGNGDASICLFPKEVTPNQHALADRFALLDNFYCCAEVSADGWNWSTAGVANEYTSRNTPYNYSGRGRSYDFEGENNDVPVGEKNLRDVAEPAGGYIWDLCKKHGISYRNYGFFIRFDAQQGASKGEGRSVANKKSLEPNTDPDFRQFDLSYPDSQASQKYGLTIQRQMASFGSHGSASRFAEWKREFDGYVRSNDMPQFTMIRLPRDHTSGSAPGVSSARAMVADNDYAVGQIVEAVSHSPFWQSTLICIVEDDAQNGYDHIDAHRSTAYIVSPYIAAGTVDSHFYNTDSILRTIESVFKLPPMNGYDAVAPTLAVFADSPSNLRPYQAILPARSIVGQINGRTAYRGSDSARLIGRFDEESEADEQLNDILWGSIKGARTPRPPIRHGVRMSFDRDASDSDR